MNWNSVNIKERREEFSKRFENFLVFDIETVIDEEMFEKVADEKEIEKREKGEFLPNPFHKIVAFSYILIKQQELKLFESFVSKDEKKIIQKFWKIFRKAHSFSRNKDGTYSIKNFPVIITVNGKDFDMPVIKLRTLKYINTIDDGSSLDENARDFSIKQFVSIYMDRFDKWEDRYPRYTNRYTLYHIDLASDIFGGNKVSLKNMCYLCEIPVKQEGKGNEVYQLYKDGNFDQIARYCAEDVKATSMLFAYINTHLLNNLYKFVSTEILKDINPRIMVL